MEEGQRGGWYNLNWGRRQTETQDREEGEAGREGKGKEGGSGGD